MGTDIHLHVEKRTKDGKWHWVREVPTEYRNPWLVEQAEKRKASSKTTAFDRYYLRGSCEKWFDTRNYNAFAILANVRNGRGFAGCETGAGFKFIAEPRGLPEDMSEELLRGVLLYEHNYDDAFASDDDMAIDDFGDHSQSWVTLAELLAVNWDEGATQYGVIPFPAWKPGEAPKDYSAWISGGNIVIIDARNRDEFAVHLEAQRLADTGKEVYVQIAWGETYKEAAGDLYTRLLPALKSLGGDPNDVRIVFGFDS